MPTSRRVFILQLAGTSSAAVVTVAARGQGAPGRVDPADPQATPLGYVEDAGQVDPKRFPRRTAGQVCGNCQVYAGKPSAREAPCTVFAGKLVPASGWCSAWVLKAA